MSSVFPGSGLGSPLDVRMRRESRRSRALLTTRSAALARQEVTHVKETAVAPPRPALVEGTQACSEDLAAWLAAMHSFVLAPGKVLESLHLGVLQSDVTKYAVPFDPMEVLDDDFYSYVGGKDSSGECHGTGVLEYDDGSYVSGTWSHGVRQGLFKVDTNKPGCEVVYLEGHYQDDRLEGLVKVQRMDGCWEEGWYKTGVLHGFCRTFSKTKELTFVAMHRNGRAFGTGWRMIPGGGCVVGRVNEEGELTGSDLAYLYPDLKTAIVGTFEKGELVSGQTSSLQALHLDYGAVKVPKFLPGQGPFLRRQISTTEQMTDLPLVQDPYEQNMVVIQQSSVPGAEEGLFARGPTPPNTVLAFYNGIRSKKPSDGPQFWQEESNAYKIFDPTCKEGVVNIPSKYHQLSSYCASLAHKTNHSFVPNCEFGEFWHPRWGLVPCIVSKHHMAAGEEAFVWYGYDLDYCPAWYLDAWEKQAFTVPDSMRSEYGLS